MVMRGVLAAIMPWLRGKAKAGAHDVAPQRRYAPFNTFASETRIGDPVGYRRTSKPILARQVER